MNLKDLEEIKLNSRSMGFFLVKFANDKISENNDPMPALISPTTSIAKSSKGYLEVNWLNKGWTNTFPSNLKAYKMKSVFIGETYEID